MVSRREQADIDHAIHGPDELVEGPLGDELALDARHEGGDRPQEHQSVGGRRGERETSVDGETGAERLLRVGDAMDRLEL